MEILGTSIYNYKDETADRGSVIYKYLAKNNLIGKYIKYTFQQRREMPKKEDIKGFLKAYKLIYAFTWDETKEGKQFWLEHHQNLERILMESTRCSKESLEI